MRKSYGVSELHGRSASSQTDSGDLTQFSLEVCSRFEINTPLDQTLDWFVTSLIRLFQADQVTINLLDHQLLRLAGSSCFTSQRPGLCLDNPALAQEPCPALELSRVAQVSYRALATVSLLREDLPAWNEQTEAQLDQIAAWLGLALDRLLLQNQLAKANQQEQRLAKLEKTFQLMREFTHDLSQPLTTLQIELDLLPPPANPADQEVLEQLKAATHDMVECLHECRVAIRETQKPEWS